MIRIMIADDQELFGELLGHMLAKSDDMKVVARVTDGMQAVEQALILKPDVILMDVSMPICDGVEAIRRIRKAEVGSRILVLTSSHDGQDVQDAIMAGAEGYVLKSITQERLILAIKSVHAGMEVKDHDIYAIFKHVGSGIESGRVVKVGSSSVQLTDRDLQILQMIVDGKGAAEMSTHLFLTEGRIRNIITELTSRLMLQDRTQLAVFAIRNRLVKLD